MSGYQHNAKFSREAKKKFFSVCIDDFFLNPDKIRVWGLSLDKIPSCDGAWPGGRSDELFKINNVGNQHIVCKILSAYFDMSYVVLVGHIVMRVFNRYLRCLSMRVGFIKMQVQTKVI